MTDRAHDRANGRLPSRRLAGRGIARAAFVTLAITALVTLVARAVGGQWLSECSLSAPLGWTIPISTALVVAGVWWLLMSQGRVRTRRNAADEAEVTCASCGRTVLRDWRLCPYCGSALDEDEPAEETQPASE